MSNCIYKSCSLFGTRPVGSDGPLPAPIMLIGESPGEKEHLTGKPFRGRAGDELNNYLYRAGLHRSSCYVTNLIKCHPPRNRNPKVDEIRYCSNELIGEIIRCHPQVIGTLGAFSTRFLLGSDTSLEYVHGIPYRIDKLPNDVEIPEVIVVPCYHPALGLHKSEMMSHIMMDFQALAKVFRNELCPREPSPYTEVDYRLITDPDEIIEMPVVAIDTEWARGRPWCITYSTAPHMARMIMADNKACVKRLAEWLADPAVICDIHNSLYDLPVLWSLDVYPAVVSDTMGMAYLLQTEPQALKPLAYRYLNANMQDYEDVVGVASVDNALTYLFEVLSAEWPDPEPVLSWSKGEIKIRQPSNIIKRVDKILKDYDKSKEVNIYKRWRKIKEEEGRGDVEEALGVMPPGELTDIPFDDAFNYACKDADVTFQIKPLLWKKIQNYKLEDVFWRDMHMIPMVAEMQTNGMRIDPEHFGNLARDFERRLGFINTEIDNIAKKHINPGSYIQALELLMKLKVFDGNDKLTTNAKYLKKHINKHPVVEKVIRWRELDKLRGTYAVPLPKHMDENNRVHTTLRVTRVITGRLSSSSPNLMNIPIKTQDGLKIRAGFIPEYGCVLLSNDYSQIELRVLAHMSQDQHMMEAFWNDEDLHTKTAKLIYELDGGIWEMLKDDEKKLRRKLVKPVNFGIAYGLSAKGLFYDLTSQGIKVTLADCERFINAWFNAYPGVYIWLDEVKAEARRTGMVRDMFGRMRLCPEGYAADKWVKLAGERQAINAPIQSGAQGIIKEAMGKLKPVYRDLTEGGRYICRPLMQIHDDLLFEVSEEITKFAAQVINPIMAGVVELSVPVKVGSKYGYNWRDMESLEI